MLANFPIFTELQEIREPARLHRIVADAIEGQLGKVPERNTAVLVLDANHSRKLVSNSIDSAFTSGYGICGSKDLHALPAYIEDVANAVSSDLPADSLCH